MDISIKRLVDLCWHWIGGKRIVEIHIKKLVEDAKIPCYHSDGASGFDLHSIENVSLLPHEYRAIRTGIAVELPCGYELQIRPRSGLALKYGVTVLNAPGTIDSDYRGEIQVILINHSDTAFEIAKGDRIAQGVLCAVQQASFKEVNELDSTQRGDKGFGSTGTS